MTIFILFAALLSVAQAEQDTTLMVDIEEVTVSAANKHTVDNSISVVEADKHYLEQNFSGSLMTTLSDLGGVRASKVGAGQSKPIIRGLGGNRLAVIHDDIRHEGQQWGDDHGLEIDQFAISRVQVLKGPAALLYGSDAIAGALLLSSLERPMKPFSGGVKLFTRTNNMLIGTTAHIEGITPLADARRAKQIFWRLNATYQDYADYSVPTDSIEYYSYRIPLYKNRLRNTAGREADAALTLGYAGYHWHTCLKIYETFLKSGMFANAHGLEVRLSDIDYDHSNRDIDLPYQQVNHLKVLSHTVYTQEKWTIEGNLAWQHNLRKECSEPVGHGFMPKPDGTLERGFNKHTATANVAIRYALTEKHTLRFGANAEWQHNKRSGWGFILPDFETYSVGIYAVEKYEPIRNLALNAGLRYDFQHTDISPYQDWYSSPTNGLSDNYIKRCNELHRNYHSVTWSAGASYTQYKWILKANVGKGFRVPMPKELAANGLNYHIFRYEEGNNCLQPEVSYQADISVDFSSNSFAFKLEPFVAYFPNYIYLNPTPNYAEGLQIYDYRQSKVLRAGTEVEISYEPWHFIRAELQGEYLFARQLSSDKRGYGLPFSPPWRSKIELRGKWERKTIAKAQKLIASDGYAAIFVRVTGTQHDILPPEKPTDGWWTLNLIFGQKFCFENFALSLTLNADNILNRKYYDHTSYYRLIDVPETGWNLSMMVGIEF